MLGKKSQTFFVNITIYVLLSLGALLFVFPFFWMVSTSLKEHTQVYKLPPVWIPNPLVWRNYLDALTKYQPFGTFFKNTFIIVSWVIIGDLFSSSLVAYGFARLRFPGRDILFMVLMSTMMIPLVVRLVPLFLIFQRLGWINTFLPLIVPSFCGTPFLIFLLRQFFLTIPTDLSDAARIDGCSELDIWWRIFLPLSKPALGVVIIFSFQRTWNDFLEPLIYLNDLEKRTVLLGLYGLISTSLSEVYWNLIMAAAVTIVAPLIVVFFLSQRLFKEGITITGLKG